MAFKHNQQQLVGPLPGGEPKLIAYFLVIICILSLCNSIIYCNGEINNIGPTARSAARVGAPKDYAYSPVSSRVRDLASFFESMAKEDNYDSETHKQQNVIISLSEAASKLHILSAGYPVDFKCNKYVKLINRPNIRTFATINLLMKEPKAFNEMEQNDANLMAKLANERDFDAMGKLQTIIQTLESERENMRSTFEPSVQKDLLDCMNYFIYRHQRATSGITSYAREQRDKLLPITAQPVELEVSLRKYQELVDETVRLETNEGGGDCNPRWIDNLSKLHNLLLEIDQFEVPILVRQFVTDKKRLSRLISCNDILQAVKNIEQKGLMDAETASNVEDATTAATTNGSSEEIFEQKIALQEELAEPSESTSIQESSEVLHDVDGDDDNETHATSSLEPADEENLDNKISSDGADDDNKVELAQSQVIIGTTQRRVDVDDEESKFCICGPQAQNLKLLGNSRPLNELAPLNVEQEVVLEPEAAGGLDEESETNAFQPDSTPNGAQRVRQDLCQELSIEQNDNLRLTSWGSLENDRAFRLAEGLNRFKIDCANHDWTVPGTSYLKENPSWPIVSMTKKLSTWCSDKLRDPSMADVDRATLLRVLELLYGRQQQ